MSYEHIPRFVRTAAAFFAVVGLLSGCDGCTGYNAPDDDATASDGIAGDTTAPDAPDATDSSPDSNAPPSDVADADTTPRDGSTDGSSDSENDADTSSGDSSDASELDGSSDTSDTSPQGLSVPCSNGAGWTVFKFHWSQNSGTSPRIDVWDASCSYSLAPGSTCRVTLVNSPDFNSRQPRAVLLTGSEVLRVRYDVSTLQFTDASVYVQARSYSTTASTRFEVWSPIYGAKTSPDLVDNDFVYDWYRVPWSNYLSPSDDPDLTAIEISDLGGDKLAVHAVELCVQ